jgi:uncharacterized protein
MENRVVYWELASHDADKSSRFLQDVFGWQMEYDPATTIYEAPGSMAEESCPGGVFTLRKAKLPFLTMYILVDDIQEKANQVQAAGGNILEGPFSLPSGSQICLFNEPSGVTLAMLQPAKKPAI